jgi:hypothetical protein
MQVLDQQIRPGLLKDQKSLSGRAADSVKVEITEFTQQSPDRLRNEQMIIDDEHVEHL